MRNSRWNQSSARELLEDSERVAVEVLPILGVNIESWLLDKARRACGAQISHAILVGDGFGKPLGILNPKAGIPICETSDSTPLGTS